MIAIQEVTTFSKIPNFVPFGVLYFTADTGDLYIGTGNSIGPAVVAVAASSGGGTWGSITGTLSNQTDLEAALTVRPVPQAFTSSFPAAVTSLQAFGDSITAADTIGLPTVALGWAELFCQAVLGIPLANNFAVDGARINNTGFIPTAYQKSPSNAVGSITLGMTNEVSDCVNNSSCIAQVISAYQAFMVWLGLPASSVVLASAMSKSGTWASTGSYFNLTTEYSNTANSTLTGTVSGSTVYVAGWITTGFNQSFSVTIDGVNQGTTTFTGQGSLTSATVYPYCLRFSGLSAGSHTVVLTALSGGYGIFQWIAGNGATGPFVAVGGALPQASYSETVIGNMNSALQTMIANLSADGLNVAYVNDHSALTKSAVPPQYSTQSGANVHPNILGNILLVAAWLQTFYTYSAMDGGVLATIVNAAKVTGPQLLASILTLLNQSPIPETISNAGQCLQSYLGTTGQFESTTRRNCVASGAAGTTGLNVTGQAAAQSAVSILTTTLNTAAGLYEITYAAVVTQAATNSSTLGGANGFQVTYTDNDTGTSVTTVAGPTNAGNSVGSQINGAIVVNAKTGTAITISFGYTSSGATVMQYALHVSVELIG
jgi:hypothetical protein